MERNLPDSSYDAGLIVADALFSANKNWPDTHAYSHHEHLAAIKEEATRFAKKYQASVQDRPDVMAFLCVVLRLVRKTE